MIRDRWDWVVLGAIGLNIFDMLMTLPFWSMEANPLLLRIGPGGMVIAKIGAGIGLAYVWWRWEGVNTHPVSKLCVTLLATIYSAVVLSNTAVLIA